MSSDITPRRAMAERITGAIWGAIVTATGALLIAALSGYDVDLELVVIVSLAALGGWLLFSALAVAARQSRRERDASRAIEVGPQPAQPSVMQPVTGEPPAPEQARDEPGKQTDT